MHTISRAERVQAIVFLVIGVLLIAGVCGLLIGIPLLRNTRQYFVRFDEKISGIDKGTDVRYQGVKKGRVKSWKVDYDIIELEIEIDSDLRITESTLAQISSDGILPPYYVNLAGSLRDSPELPEGRVIKTDPSMTSTLVQKGTEIAGRLDGVLKNLERWTGSENEQKLTRLLDEASSTMATANNTVTTLRPEAERLIKGYADAGEQLARAIEENREALHGFIDDSRKVMGELNHFVESGRLDQISNEATKTLESIRGDFSRAASAFSNTLDDARVGDRLKEVVATLERAEQDLSRLTGVVQTEVVGVARSDLAPALASFREAMTNLQELTRVLRDDPSLVIFSKPRAEIPIPRPGNR